MRGDDGSIVLSEVSSDSEQLVLNCCSPVDEADNGDYQQSHLLYGQNLTEEWTRRSLVMLPSSTATENLLVSGCALIVPCITLCGCIKGRSRNVFLKRGIN